ncbi:MAG: glycosyl hydrolase [Verrucomicrobiota bacterium]
MKLFSTGTLFLSALALGSLQLAAQSLTFSNGVQRFTGLTNTTVTMTGMCELRVSGGTSPLVGCTVNLNSPDAWLFLTGIKPSVAAASYLTQVKISGASAVVDSNCRVVQYGPGAVIIPHAPSFKPLQIFTGPYFTGSSSNLGQYVYYKGTALGLLNATISSFKLKRGYMATFAQNESGSGISKNYVAADGDMEISLLPDALDDNVRFIYVTPWRWVSKKGIAGNIEGPLNVSWKYNWNLDQNSTRDRQYVPIRQQRWWPSLNQNWQTIGAEHVLGYNEPDQANQANLAVGDAIYSWPDLLGTGLRVGAPAVSDGGRSSWLYPFMTQADAAGLRVDFVPIHYYQCRTPSDAAGAASQMYAFLKATYDTVKRPLWVTEWNNGANWTTCTDPSAAQQQAAVAAMIAMLDSTPFVERYSLYNWVEDVRRVEWDDGSLTAAGVTYRDQVSPIGYVQALQDNGTRSFTQLSFETNTLDTSGYGNNGITAGTPAYTNGHSGQALAFDGANTVVTLPPNVATNNSFSFAAWIYWNGGANWQRIFDFGNSTTHYLFLTPSSGSGTLRFAICNGGSEQTVQTAALAVGSWQHVAVTLSGNTARLYVNGVLAASNTGMSISPASFSPRVNCLGKSQFADPLFNGLMDEVLITDYALSAAQVAALQTNAPPQFTGTFFTRGTATEGILYSNSIAGLAIDANPGDPLVFSKAVGPAWLNIAADGTMTGTPTSGDGGTNFFTVRVVDSAGQCAFALVTVSVTTVTAAGTWTADASANWGVANRWSGNIIATGAGQTADFATINITGNRVVTLEASRTIGGLKFSDISGSQSWTLAANPGASLKLDMGSAASPVILVTNTATISAPLTGTNGFTKVRTGTLILTGNNPLSGTVYLDSGSSTTNDGIVRIVGPNALANASIISIRNNNSGRSTFQLDGSTGSITIEANLTITYRNNGVVTIQNLAGTNIFNGNIQLFQGGNSHTVQSDAGLIVFTGTNQYVGSAVGIRTNYFTGAGDHLLFGPILDATNGSPVSLTKSGSGRLTLWGINTYTNGTTLSGGKLYVDGVLPAAPFLIGGGATLGGQGVIYAPVNLPAGGTLSPGDRVGKLTVSNSVTLALGSVTALEIDKLAGTNDQLRVTGNLNLGGTLFVSSLSGTLVPGDQFKLLDAPNYSGAFNSTNFPQLNPGMAWSWNQASGTLSVIQTTANYPTNLVTTYGGGVLSLSWPDTHSGWRLETNATDITDAGAWFNYPSSAFTNRLDINLDPEAANVFFRLAFP